MATFPIGLGTIDNSICEGRLTLTSGTAVTTSDVTGATSVYWTPHNGNRVALYDGTRWTTRTFSELTLALGTLVLGQAYDVFVYDNSGTLTLETAEWHNATVTMTIASPCVVTWTAHGMNNGDPVVFTTTGALPTGLSANTVYYVVNKATNTFEVAATQGGASINTSGTQSGTHTGHDARQRQTALTLQDGVLVKSGATTRRYLGTFYTTSTTQTEDSAAKRFLWNLYNQTRRYLRVADTTDNWTYSTQTFRQVRGSSANQVEVIIGVAGQSMHMEALSLTSSTVAPIAVSTAIGPDTTSSVPNQVGMANAVAATTGTYQSKAVYDDFPAVGYHYYAWLELGGGSGTQTWYGDNGVTWAQTGMQGGILM